MLTVWSKLLAFLKLDLTWDPEDGLELTVSKLCLEMPMKMMETSNLGSMLMNPKMEPLKLSVSILNKNQLTGWKPLEISKIVMSKSLMSPNPFKTKLMKLKKKKKKKSKKLKLTAKKMPAAKVMNTTLKNNKMKILKMSSKLLLNNWKKKVLKKPKKESKWLKKLKKLKNKLLN